MIQAPLILASGSQTPYPSADLWNSDCCRCPLSNSRGAARQWHRSHTLNISQPENPLRVGINMPMCLLQHIVCLNDMFWHSKHECRIYCVNSQAWHTVITAWAIAFHPQALTGAPHIIAEGTSSSDVKFRALQSAEIQSYIRTGEGRDKAGSYGIQGLGAALVESIRGDYSNIVGLPMTDVIQALGAIGIRPTLESS